MSKIRTIKPEFWSSEQIVRCSIQARLLFIGMWNFCDDAGVHPASILTLKMLVFPGDTCSNDDIKKLVDELIDEGLLLAYKVGGKKYWQVTGWHHQRITRPFYKYPKPKQYVKGDLVVDECCLADTKQGLNIDSAVPKHCSGSVSTVLEHPRIGKDRKGINICKVDKSTSSLSFSKDVVEVFAYWQSKLDHPKAKLDKKRARKIQEALHVYSMDDLKLAIEGCAASKFHLGDNEQGIRYDGVGLIFRDPEHIEKFMAIADKAHSKVQLTTPLALDE